ncbi:uncharacterized protein LOC129092387 isoform X2 [Anoplopoma fimbria]|uniref:uncharacterized protein LOC129092387 isoform X2 n=1 Tax=Anoplopoma fimbria TaxID=229290 RepID=UPI0023ED2345|nr:uncharacterized protein LOC129092387 isoform X2 [Anoplopoma fimbria]
MLSRENLTRVLLIGSLLLTVARCRENTVLLYSRLGSDILLPCISSVSLDCSLITWTFYQGGQVRYSEEVIGGQVKAGTDKSSRLYIMPNCSLTLRNLVVHDAGSYNCLKEGQSITAAYVSLLTISSPSAITELQFGGRLALSCILFTYFNVGLCMRHSNTFNLNWAAEDGAVLGNDTRHDLIFSTSCNITLVIELKREDNNRKWRCQAAQNQIPSSSIDGPVQLPISRIMLCVALPVMVLIVAFFTWRGGHKRAKASAAGIKL